jgi:hypothetical protein
MQMPLAGFFFLDKKVTKKSRLDKNLPVPSLKFRKNKNSSGSAGLRQLVFLIGISSLVLIGKFLNGHLN